jgi:hypothetical protein
MDADE